MNEFSTTFALMLYIHHNIQFALAVAFTYKLLFSLFLSFIKLKQSSVSAGVIVAAAAAKLSRFVAFSLFRTNNKNVVDF